MTPDERANSAIGILLEDRPLSRFKREDSLSKRVDLATVAVALEATAVGYTPRQGSSLPSRLAASLAGFQGITGSRCSLASELELEFQLDEDSDADLVAAEVVNMLPALDRVERICGGVGLSPARLSLNYRASSLPPPLGLLDCIAGRMSCFHTPDEIVESELIPKDSPFPGGHLATAIVGCLIAGVRIELRLRGPGGWLHSLSTPAARHLEMTLPRLRRAANVVRTGPCLSVETPFALQLGLRIDETFGQIAEVILQLSDEEVGRFRQAVSKRIASIRDSRP